MNLCFFKCITSHYCGQNAGLLKATPSLTDRKSAAAGYGRLGFSNSVGRPNLTSLRTLRNWEFFCVGEITSVEDADEVDQIALSSGRGYHRGLSTLPRPLSTTKLSSPDNGVNIRIAYQGFPGAFSEAAALKLHPQCETVPCDEFETALEAVELLLVDKAVLPMECSVGGSIHYNYDLLLCHRLYIVGEVQMIANHHLLGLTGVRKVDKQEDSEKIARFQILAREPIIPGTDKPYKTSIVLTLKEGPGVLFKVLALFAMRGINLSKIESRPRKGQPLRDDFDNGRVVYFDYIFYIDFEASMAEPHAQNAMKHLQELTKFRRVLGCYPVYAPV